MWCIHGHTPYRDTYHMYCHTAHTHNHTCIHLYHSYTLSNTHIHFHTFICSRIHLHSHTQLDRESIEVTHISCPLLSCSRGNTRPLDLKPPLLHRSQEHILWLFEDSYIVQNVSGSLIHCRCYNRVKRNNGLSCYLFWYPCLS